MLQKSKLAVSLVTPVLVAFLSIQGVSAASNVTLKKEMRGSAVTELQKNLKLMGFMSVDPTGYFGSVTEEAVKQFQKEYGLTADGIAGKQTLAKIEELQNSGTLSSRGAEPVDLKNVVLKNGMSGTGVTELQKALIKLGFMDVDATGYFGDITTQAVKEFQKKYGLEADGIAGEQTISKLDSLLGSQTVSKAAAATSKEWAASRGTTSTAQKIIDYAKKYLGVKYVWGGSSAKGFDCSGFTQFVFKKYGISISRSSASQAKNGKYVKKADLKPGDLVFFDTNGGKNGINHVGIYIGSGKFIHASSSHKGVTISSLNESFYSKCYMTARRVL